MNPKFTLQEYNKVYPTGSSAGKLYGTAKIRYLAKHAAKILAPLSKSEYAVLNAKGFLIFIKPQKIPINHQLISFDVVSLFTNAPINATIVIIIRRINESKEIDTRITKNEMRELILLCTKNFTFNGEKFT